MFQSIKSIEAFVKDITEKKFKLCVCQNGCNSATLEGFQAPFEGQGHLNHIQVLTLTRPLQSLHFVYLIIFHLHISFAPSLKTAFLKKLCYLCRKCKFVLCSQRFWRTCKNKEIRKEQSLFHTTVCQTGRRDHFFTFFHLSDPHSSIISISNWSFYLHLSFSEKHLHHSELLEMITGQEKQKFPSFILCRCHF